MNENLLSSEEVYTEPDTELQEENIQSTDTVESFTTETVDFAGPAFTGLGVTAAITLFSLGVAVLLKLLQRTSS